MTYSAIGLLAIFVLLIINNDVFSRKSDDRFHAKKDYRLFLISVIAYHVTDAAWGVLYEYHLISAVYIDTVLYFIVMALSVLLWTKYVLHYLGKKSRFVPVLHIAGGLYFLFQIAALAVNLFTPIFFWFDGNAVYHEGVARNVALYLQILILSMTAIYTLIIAFRSHGTVRHRHFTVGLFGVIMILAIAAQIFYPLLPLYSVGFLLGICLLRTFVVEEEKREYREELHDSYFREVLQKKELEAAKSRVLTDPLTGVGSKHAYVDAEEELDRRISQKEKPAFAVAVFDLNSLKQINDTYGHEAGDRCIAAAASRISGVFGKCLVFRIGGDEFAVILEGAEYENCEELMALFNRKNVEQTAYGEIAIASGYAKYDENADGRFGDVFNRADREMYKCKKSLKDPGAGEEDR